MRAFSEEEKREAVYALVRSGEVYQAKGPAEDIVDGLWEAFRTGVIRDDPKVYDLWNMLLMQQIGVLSERKIDTERSFEVIFMTAADSYEGLGGKGADYNKWNTIISPFELSPDLETLIPEDYEVKPFAKTLLEGAGDFKANPYRAVRWLIVAANRKEEGAAEDLEKLYRESKMCRAFVSNMITAAQVRAGFEDREEFLKSEGTMFYPYCLERTYGTDEAQEEYYSVCREYRAFELAFPDTDADKLEKEAVRITFNVLKTVEEEEEQEKKKEQEERKKQEEQKAEETKEKERQEKIRDARSVAPEISTVVLLAAFLGGGLLYRYTQTHYLDISFFLTIIYRVISVIMILGGGVAGFTLVGLGLTNESGIGMIAGLAAGIWAAVRMFKAWKDPEVFMLLVKVAAVAAVLMLIAMIIKKVRPLKDT